MTRRHLHKNLVCPPRFVLGLVQYFPPGKLPDLPRCLPTRSGFPTHTDYPKSRRQGFLRASPIPEVARQDRSPLMPHSFRDATSRNAHQRPDHCSAHQRAVQVAGSNRTRTARTGDCTRPSMAFAAQRLVRVYSATVPGFIVVSHPRCPAPRSPRCTPEWSACRRGTVR